MASEEPGLEHKSTSRTGMRRVSSLSAEQLEQKRANDREAQRLVRQRTKAQLERFHKQIVKLQSQIDRMEPYGEQLGEVMQQNAALTDENYRLKHQLASLTRPGLSHAGEQVPAYHAGWRMDEAPAIAKSRIPSTGPLLPSQYTGMPHAPPMDLHAPSIPSTSSRSPQADEWEQHSTTPSPSLCQSSET